MSDNTPQSEAIRTVFAPLDHAIGEVDERVRGVFTKARLGLGESVKNAVDQSARCRLTRAIQAAYQAEQFAGALRDEAIELAAEGNISGDDFAEIMRTTRGVWTERLPDAIAATLVRECGCSIRPL